jgi:hypothetical protein
MFTRQDLRELVLLTALGAVVGLVHLGLRPELPVLAEPAAACSLDAMPEAAAPVVEAPAASMEPAVPMTPVSEPAGGAP